MRKYELCTVLFTFLIAFTFDQVIVHSQDEQSEQRSPEWKWITEREEFRVYLNQKSVSQTTQGTILAWEKTVPRTDTPEGRADKEEEIKLLIEVVGIPKEKAAFYDHELIQREYDCTEGKVRMLLTLSYDTKGRVINKVAASDVPEEMRQWQYPPPGTINKTLMKTVCEIASRLEDPSSPTVSP